MAEDVYQTLKQIIQTHGQMTEKEVESFMLSLRVRIHFTRQKYHVDEKQY